MCFFSKHQLDDRNIFLFINTEFNRKKMYHDYQIKVYLDELQTHYTLVLINLIRNRFLELSRLSYISYFSLISSGRQCLASKQN